MTTPTPLRVPRALHNLLIPAVALFALAGCASPGEAGPTETPSGTSGEASGGESTEEGEGGDCLVGDWFITEDQMDLYYDAIESEGVEFDIDGGTGLSFTDTRYEYTPEFTLNLLITSGVSGEGTITGSISGDYSTEDGLITTEHDTNDTALVVTVSGVTIDGTGLFDDFLSSAPINSAPFECNDGVPTIMFEAGDSPRVPVTLTPRN